MDVRLPLAAAAALAAGPWLFWKGFRCLRTLRLIENTPTAKIRSMAIGLVEVHGAIRARSAARAPFSSRSCAYWEVDVSVRGRTRRSWTVVHRNQSGQPFFLEDEGGVALVFPRGAECKIRYATDEECFGLNLPACYADYLERHRGLLARAARLGVLRFRERVLEDGQQVYVLGTALPRGQALVVSEGEVVAGTGTDGHPGSARLRERDEGVSAVIRKGESEPTFLISQESEHELVAGLRWRVAAMVLGGPPLALFGLFYWLMTLTSGRPPW